MRVVVIYNDQMKLIEEEVNPKFKYIAKTIELLDNLRMKYTHVYNDHISSKYYEFSGEYKNYISLFKPVTINTDENDESLSSETE